jgi:hypothetical protein
LGGLLGRAISPSQGRYLHGTTQTQNKRGQTSMPLAGFEPTIPVFKRAKTFHALDSAATVTGEVYFCNYAISPGRYIDLYVMREIVENNTCLPVKVTVFLLLILCSKCKKLKKMMKLCLFLSVRMFYFLN